MKTVELRDSEGRVRAWMCGVCRHVHAPTRTLWPLDAPPASWLRDAEECCACATCKSEHVWGGPPWPAPNECPTCHAVRLAASPPRPVAPVEDAGPLRGALVLWDNRCVPVEVRDPLGSGVFLDATCDLDGRHYDVETRDDAPGLGVLALLVEQVGADRVRAIVLPTASAPRPSACANAWALYKALRAYDDAAPLAPPVPPTAPALRPDAPSTTTREVLVTREVSSQGLSTLRAWVLDDGSGTLLWHRRGVWYRHLGAFRDNVEESVIQVERALARWAILREYPTANEEGGKFAQLHPEVVAMRQERDAMRQEADSLDERIVAQCEAALRETLVLTGAP